MPFLKRILAGVAPAKGLQDWLAAEARIVDALAKADGLAAAASEVLDALGTALHWVYGAFWVPDGRGERLRAIATWSAGHFPADALDAATTKASLPRGEGLPGRVWQAHAPRVSAEGEPDTERERVAASLGIQGALAFPVVHEDAFFGAIEFFDRQPVALDGDLLLAATILGKVLGQFAARQRALRQIRASESEMSDLVEHAPLAIHCTDADGRIVLANRAELEMLGYSSEELLGRRFEEFHADPTTAQDILDRLRRGEEVRDLEVQLRASDGSIRWVRLSANAILREGQFVHARTFARDITVSRQDRERLRSNERRFRTLVEEVHDHALFTLDAQGRVASWNTGAERIFGFTEAEILGQDQEVTFSQEDRTDGVPGRLARIAADEGEFRHEGWRARDDGTRFWAESLFTALRDATGEVEEIAVLVRDVTERRRMEDLRRRSGDLESANRTVVLMNQQQEEVLGRIAAAIDAPVSALASAGERLREKLASGAPATPEDLDALAAHLADVRRAVGRMSELATVAARRIEFHPERVDPLRLAMETRDLLKAPAAARQVRVEVDWDHELTELVTDPVRLKQVAYNFLSNAIKFSRDRGRVILRIVPEGPETFRIEVEDSGIGIPPEELPGIFAPREDPEGGTRGLGLAATKRIAEQQGGRVGVQSTLGRGSTFFAVLPRVLVPESAPEAGTVEPVGRRVLVVAEEASARANLSWTFGKAGHEVIAATSAEEALDVARERRCDVVAIDLALGPPGAVDFATSLRQEGASRGVPVLLPFVRAEGGAVAGLAVADLVAQPPQADRLFSALERAGVPRGRSKRLLVLDGNLETLRSTARVAEVLGYRTIADPDADASLKACADDPPAALLLSLSPLGMDPFTFLHHLRRMPGTRGMPVILTAPRELGESAAADLQAAAESALREGAGEAGRILDSIDAATAAPGS